MKRVALLLVACALACGSPGEGPLRPASGVLRGQLATVGAASIDAPTVADVARSRGVSARQALDAVVEDTLLAQGAQAQGVARAPDISWTTTASLGRLMAGRFLADARAMGPPSPDELSRLRVVHVAVLRSRTIPEPQLRFAASTLAQAVSKASSATDFLARVKAARVDVVTSAEELSPFDASGTADDGKRFDPAFVAGAFQLGTPGDTSPVVESKFGWHVIRLLERLPPATNTEAAREELTEAVMQLRARIALSTTIARRRQTSRVELAPGADELMASAFKSR
ncbi:MAG TPA: peptidylprolyl isomerase [Polyangiaceae bacterium]